MLQEESVWIGKQLSILATNNKISPLLNFGSSTGHFRNEEQPIIYNNVFKPLEDLGIVFYHLDIKGDDGVDFVGDVIKDKQLYNSIKEKKIKTILCSNLLEHVPDRKPFFKIMEDILDDGGFILITVPNLYPYHADPLDTKYRPSIADIMAGFSNAKLIKGEIITINQTHFQFMLSHPKLFPIIIFRIFTPFYRFSVWKKIIADIPNIFKKFKVTCVLLQIVKN